jgi:hypothetical protein
MRLFFALAALLLVLPSAAQQPEAASPASSAATVKFTLDWPQARPWTSFSITVQTDGKSHFEGTPNPEDGGDSGLYQQDFAMSEPNRAKIFELARKLNYFNCDFETHLKHIAQTGKKTLEYTSPQAHGSSSYNWSQNPDVQQLTHLFWSISTTFDYGRKLAFQYRFDKLGMDSRLKQLVEAQADHNVEELVTIEPILRKIANDPGMMHISRQSAQELLHDMHAPATADQATALP